MMMHDNGSGAGIRVLIVEDHPVIAELVETRLRIEGLDATKCLGGREAIERLNRELFDLVILDIMMPDVDGYEVLAHIRSREASRQRELPQSSLPSKAPIVSDVSITVTFAIAAEVLAANTWSVWLPGAMFEKKRVVHTATTSGSSLLGSS